MRIHYGKVVLGIGLLLTLGVAALHAQRQPRLVAQEVYWPNAESKANSDDWLHLHHNEIRQMRPKLLVLNFVNGLPQPDGEARVTALMLALREASRYHHYSNEGAPPFLEYQLAKYVDLSDKQPLPEDQVLDGNSSLYPRVPNWKEGINFRYGELFSDKFAALYGIADPDNPNKMLNLKELVDRGMVHEVWFIAKQGKYGAPYECTEVKQAYDAAGNKIPGQSVQAGNGGSPEQPFIGRSLRILFMNVDRGPGCAMESLGHAVEGTSNSNAIPYFTRYFTEFAGFDLKKRYGLPFDSLYARNGADIDYPELGKMTYTWEGKKHSVVNYVPIGGNVHFAPNARKDYDLSNSEPVLSTIEHYRLHDGEDGKDLAEPWEIGKIAPYATVAPDCQGPWVVFWRQSFPGLDNKCVDANNKPMKNWWPFLFY